MDLKRIKKDVDGTVQKFIYDGPNVVVEYDGNNALLATYLTPGLDENLTMTRNSATYYYHQDGLGSIRNLTDSSEVAQNTYDYYAFGSVVGSPTENVTNDYRFTGRRWDDESAQYYYRTRYYRAGQGSFCQKDKLFQLLNLSRIARSLGYSKGIIARPSLYAFVNGNPVNFVDPYGYDSVKENDARQKCEQMKEDAFRQSGRLRKKMDNLKSKGCPTNITCICCSKEDIDKGKIAATVTKQGKGTHNVQLCYNNPKLFNRGEQEGMQGFRGTLAHELEHVRQDCFKEYEGRDPDDFYTCFDSESKAIKEALIEMWGKEKAKDNNANYWACLACLDKKNSPAQSVEDCAEQYLFKK